MPSTHRPIPELLACPRVQPIAKDLHRSYPVGLKEFSRAFAQNEMELSISSPSGLTKNVLASLVTTINAPKEGDWIDVPFVRTDENTLTCRITPGLPGLYCFWARFSLDGGSTWIHDPVPDAWVLVDPPSVDHVRLYSMIPTVSGTIADWSDDLPRIKDLGFNTVHLLPITTLDTSQSPYAARDLFSVDYSYLVKGGSLDGLAQLEQFIERARSLELKLCFDLVLNHVGVNSTIVKRAPEWIMPDENSPDKLRRARYWSDKGWLPWNDLVLIDYEHSSERIRDCVWNYMTEYALFWAKYANDTNGFVRFDNLHSSDKNFVTHLTQKLHAEYPNVGILAEYFTDAGTLLTTVPAWGLNLILATPWDSRFVPQLRDYLKYIHSISEHIRFFMPITSHDSGSPAQEFGAADSTIPRYVAAALMGTGATGITQGVEWGDEKRTEFIGTHPKLVRTGKPRYGDFIRQVNQILEGHPIFRRGENCMFVDRGHHAVIACFRQDKGTPKTGYLVVCNFDILGEQLFETDLSQALGAGPRTCQELLTGEEKSFADTAHVKVLLPPCAAQVLMF